MLLRGCIETDDLSPSRYGGSEKCDVKEGACRRELAPLGRVCTRAAEAVVRGGGRRRRRAWRGLVSGGWTPGSAGAPVRGFARTSCNRALGRTVDVRLLAPP